MTALGRGVERAVVAGEAALASIERRVLWLAIRIVDYANRERPKLDPLKVGGHQASSASMVSLMTALYVGDLRAADRVSVKPHASPVIHAIEYLLGRLDRSYLTRLRDFGGLQSYPSRTKDPFEVDYSTGSVGLGSAAPLFGALADKFLESRVGATTGGRFVSLLGDAELDEGNIWEAISEPLVRRLGNVLWVVDVNRQSLDRVVPGIRVLELERQFEILGWRVLELKYGRRLRRAFASDGGDLLRARIDEISNEAYQALFGAGEEAVYDAMLGTLRGAERDRLARLLGRHANAGQLVRDLGGHDLADLQGAFADARRDPRRPTVIFAYTIKGYGLEIAGRPQNHSALLTKEQIDNLRSATGLTADTEWDRFPDESPEADLLSEAARRLERGDRPKAALISVPITLADRDPAPTSTQAAFGRTLLNLSRIPEIRARLVTVSPDVSVSTSLGGFINKVGIWGTEQVPAYDEDEDGPLHWRVTASGQHIELGIAEMNLVLLLGQLGLTWDYQRERLFPIGTLYDPFVMRALEGIVYGVYSGSRFILAGTPSGITLSREGGAHQSLNTPGIGMETPGITYCEPCFARELEWLLLDALARMQEDRGEALYLRLSTKPIVQAPFTELVNRSSVEAVRRNVIAGAYVLTQATGDPDDILIATCGAMVPEALEARELLADQEGVGASVLVLSSPDRLYRDWQTSRSRPLRDGLAPRDCHLTRIAPAKTPVVTVIDGASHALAWLGSALGVHCVPLGVDNYGEVGSPSELYSRHGISPDSIATGALVALDSMQRSSL
jgi:pyruvate dehydrogenase E1 component